MSDAAREAVRLLEAGRRRETFASDLDAARRNRAVPSREREGGELAWLESAAALLAEPDPGPTPFLIEGLIVDGAIAAIQGPPKVGKTWDVLEFASAVVTGRPALGHFEVPKPGPAIVVLEESGRAALHRRLDLLRRGTGTDVDALADLHFAANRRVRLDDPVWRERLLTASEAIRPRAIFLDPLARLKGAGTDEDSQKEMGPLLDFMRDLRDATGAAVVFVHHTGHDRGRMRGTSDLEAYWESKVSVGREPEGVCQLSSEHREAEAGPPVRYRLAWDHRSLSLRLELIDPPKRATTLLDAVRDHVAEHPGQTADALASALGKRRADVGNALREGEAEGELIRRPSDFTDAGGRRRTREGWYPASAEGALPFPESGKASEGLEAGPSTASIPDGDTPVGGARGKGSEAASDTADSEGGA